MSNKIYVNFLPPFDSLTGTKEAEIKLDKMITLEEFQRLILEKYPQIKESNIQLEHIYYIINDNPPKKDKSININNGDKITLYSPALGG